MVNAGAQRLEQECEELEEQLHAARQNLDEQDAALNLAMEDKLTAGEEARQTLDDLAVFAEEVQSVCKRRAVPGYLVDGLGMSLLRTSSHATLQEAQGVL